MKQKITTILFWCLALLTVTAVYSAVFKLGFARVDDKWSILHNPLVGKPFTINYFNEVLVSYNSIQYSPLNTLYYNLIYHINGYDPYYFHLGSFLFHIANATLVYLLCNKTLSIFNLNEHKYGISFICALFWAIHPINVESVAWLAASKVVLYTFFTLLSLNFFIQYLQNKNAKYLFFVIVSYILAFACKEQALVNSFMFLMIKLVIEYDKKLVLKFNRNELIFFSIAVILSITFCYITIDANGSTGRSRLSFYPFYQRFFLGFYCLFFYVLNFFAPSKLHYHYPFPMKVGQQLPYIYYMYFLIVLGSVIAVVKYKMIKFSKFLVFCILCALSQIILCLQFLPLSRPAIVADRYMYIPSFFLLLFVLVAIHNFLKNSIYRKYTPLLIALYFIYFSLYSFSLVENWKLLDIRY